MTSRHRLLTAAVVLACGSVTMAQRPAPTQSQSATGSKVNAFEPITVVGCIETEAEDWRGQNRVSKATSTDPEQFVLTQTTFANAPSPAPSAPLTTPAVEPVYQLTGASERLANELLHRRVEVLGKSNPADTTHADPRPAQDKARTLTTDRPLPELEVMSIKGLTGTCI